MNNEQINAVEKFKDNLKKCFEHREAESLYPTEKSVLKYVLGVIDIHFDLALIDFERSVVQQEIDELEKETQCKSSITANCATLTRPI